MTTLHKPVRRTCSWKGRDYVLAMEPGHGDVPPQVTIREKRRRKPYGIPVGNLYVRLVLAEVTAKKKPRRRRRGGLLGDPS